MITQIETILKAIPVGIAAIAILVIFVIGAYRGWLSKIVDQIMTEGPVAVLGSLVARPLLAIAVVAAILVGVWLFIAFGWPALVWFWDNMFWPSLKAFLEEPF